MTDTNLSRRQFVVTALTVSGGFALGVGIVAPAGAASLSVRPWNDDATGQRGEINAWVVIQPDDTVIIRYGRAEMGQGSFTALPQILAEELECDWAFVKPEYASANRNVRDNKVYGSLSTGGSRAVRETGELVQQAGASARERLIAAAAKRWSVPASECAAAMSKITHKPSGRTFRFGELAVEAAAIKLDKEPGLKRPDQYKFIGRRLERLDVPLKINGSAKYGIDLEVPNMVRAAIIKCPVFGGTLKSVDEAKIASRRGVLQVVKLKDAVAVVADRTYRAQAALNALPIEWEVGPAGTTNSVQFRKAYLDALDQKGAEARHDGNVDTAFAAAAKVVEATYDVPIIAHAPMEPHPERRRRAGVGRAGLRHEARERLRPQHVLRRRLRPAAGSRRSRPGGCGFQGGRQAGEARLDARGGNSPGPLPHAGGDPLQGGVRRRRNGDCARHAQLGGQRESGRREGRHRRADNARLDQHGL